MKTISPIHTPTILGRLLCLLLMLLALSQPIIAQSFNHPGGLHTQADLDRMAAKVAAGEQPWKATWDKLIADPHAQLTWNHAAKSCICRTGGTQCTNNYTRTQEDGHAIYSLALRYRVTGDPAYADRAIYIMDAWSSTLTGFCGDQHVSLAAGHIGYLFAVGGETLRGYSGWTQSSQDAWANMLVTHFYPKNRDFLFRYHDTCPGHYRLNWFTCNMASMIAIGVFADREDIFDEAVVYFMAGPGNGNIHKAAWYIHEDGLAQAEESGRDLGHDATGWDNLTVMCEIAWNQGVDLWGYDNNRVLRALEYHAKHNLGHGVSFVPYVNCSVHNETGNYWPGGVGPHSWERAYNHYVNRQGLAAPYVSQAASQLRPDGPPNNYSTHPSRFDWLGLGSLTHYRDPIAAGATPSGLVTKVSRYRVDLTWWGSAYAKSYNIKRATTSGGPYSTIAVVGPNNTHYVDAGITPGTLYYYVVSANNPDGESANSADAAAGVYPWLWSHLKFDESSGTTALDSSGNGGDGTLMNNATWTAGQYGNSVSLSKASSQYVTLPTGANGTDNSLTDFSVSTWVNLSTVDTWARLFEFGMDSDRYMFFAPKSGGGSPQFTMTQGSGRGQKLLFGSAAFGTGWQHVAVTVTGANKTVLGATQQGVATLYVNGNPVASDSAWFHIPSLLGGADGTVNNWIGKSQYGNDPYLNGKVDDFRIYAGALTSDGVTAVMNNTDPPLPPAPPAAPAAPTGLTATLVNGFHANFSWTGVSGAHSYNVKRATTSGGPYTVMDNLGGTSFTEKGLAAGTTYYYVISALNDGGESGLSAQASITTQAAGTVQVARYEMESNVNDATGHNWHATATGTPAYLTGNVGSNAIDLDGVDDYVTLPAGVASSDDITVATWVYWDGGNAWQRIFDFGNSTSQYMFLTPASGATGNMLRFVIKNNGDEQIIEASTLAASQWVHVAVTLSGDTGTLYVNGSAVASSTAITVNPSDFNPRVNYIGKSQWPDPLFNGKIDDFCIYNYALTASAISTLAGGSSGTAPAAPTNLSATTVSSSQIDLSWTASSGADSYNVKRSTTSGGPYTTIATGVTGTSYSDTGLSASTTYYYIVSAVNASGESGNSAQASATTQAAATVPAAPTGLTATAVSASQIDLFWTASSGADSYNVKRSTTSGGPYTTIATGLTGTSYSNTGLSASTTYYYVVSAVNASGESGNSAQASATTSSGSSSTTMHVFDIQVDRANVGQGKSKATAVVTIVDSSGNPVPDAIVTVSFTESIVETKSGVTGSNGVVTITTDGSASNPAKTTGCVSNVTHATLTYDSAANVKACDPTY